MPNQDMQIIIADDEAPSRLRLKTLLLEMHHVQLCGEARNGKEALALYQQFPEAILLLDIRMPEMDGIETAEHLQQLQHPAAIIFTTAYDSFALKAFDLQAVDYLLKPIRAERLQTALQKAKALLPAQVAALKQANQQIRQHLSVLEKGRLVLVPISDIIYLRAELKYVTIQTSQHAYLLEESLAQLEAEFSTTFIRIHRNCLVARHYIAGYEKRYIAGESQWVLLLKHGDECLPISRRQFSVIKSLFKSL